jgi:hypothetical protein
MSVHEKLASLVGEWKCTNRLNFGDEHPVLESPGTATVVTRVGGQCLEIAYTWSFEGKPQEGVILMDKNGKTSEAAASWTDTFHYANSLMHCLGTWDENGKVSVTGSYAAGDGPDWHWRTEIIPSDDSFKYLMINISPDGDEQWAVEMDFTRA